MNKCANCGDPLTGKTTEALHRIETMGGRPRFLRVALCERCGLEYDAPAQARGAFMELVRRERERQHELWGVQTHSGHSWCGVLLEEAGEVAKSVNDGDNAQAMDELVQVAAVCLAAWEQALLRDPLAPAWGKFEQGESAEGIGE